MTSPTRPRPWSALVVGLVTAFAALALSVVLPAGDDDGHGPMDMMAVAPGGSVDLADLPDEHVVLYEAVAADVDTFAEVPCYCGCEEFLAHRHLLDCFVTPEGDWERHATGCGVCLGEAMNFLADQAEGRPLPEILERIDAKYGSILAPTA